MQDLQGNAYDVELRCHLPMDFSYADSRASLLASLFAVEGRVTILGRPLIPHWWAAVPNPFRGPTSHNDLAHRKALVPTCRLSFSGSYVCMYIMLFVKGYPNFMDLTLCTTTTVENQQHMCILFHTAGEKKGRIRVVLSTFTHNPLQFVQKNNQHAVWSSTL